MIIDKNGNALSYASTSKGIVIQDGNYYIYLPYENEEYCTKKAKILENQKYLSDTDYQMEKMLEAYSEALSKISNFTLSGLVTLVKNLIQITTEYSEIIKNRSAARLEINSLENEIQEPSLTEEEIKAAEEAAEQKLKEMGNGNT